MNLYERALSQWGIEAQRMMLIEEMGEVMQALSHEYRGRCDAEKVAAELVGLQIVLNSVKLHYMNEAECAEVMNSIEQALGVSTKRHAELRKKAGVI